MSYLKLENLSSRIDEFLLDNINLEINKNEYFVLLGQSGSGKTRLLETIAGLNECSGSIFYKEKDISKKASEKRDIGFVYQDFALFPNLNVEKNIKFSSKYKKIDNEKELFRDIVGFLKLEHLLNRETKDLSGGEKQRVAIARALYSRPKILLLDEPLSALDLTMRKKLQDDIKKFHNEFNITTIMVSHDPSEIYKLSSRVILLEHGKILKDGKAKDVLLKTSGSQKFSFKGELLEIYQADILNIAIVSIGEQLVKVVLDSHQALELDVGDMVTISTKAFAPTISKI